MQVRSCRVTIRDIGMSHTVKSEDTARLGTNVAASLHEVSKTGETALDSDRPSPVRIAAVENAIRQAAFILERIDAKWPEKP